MGATEGAAAAAAENSVIQGYDIAADRQQMNETLTNSAEIDALTTLIEVGNPESIISFGAGPTVEISKTSDLVLKSMAVSASDSTTLMFDTLAKVMAKFDMREIKQDNGFFAKLFGNANAKLDSIVSKYTGLGGEVDHIYILLKQYEDDIRRSNKELKKLFDANVSCYHELVKYILAGEQGCRELTEYIQQRTAAYEASRDGSIQFELVDLNQNLRLLEQRVNDLKIAETVVMQAIPMIKLMEYNNMNLLRKINSAFIVTLPVFKQALAQAIMLKRQKIQADSMAALDAKTNEMLRRNAGAIAERASAAAGGASAKESMATLETTWKTIINGIDESRKIHDDAQKQREAEAKRLADIRQEFDRKNHKG